MVLGYLSIKYIILCMFISSINILGHDNIEIYIHNARSERLFGNAGK